MTKRQSPIEYDAPMSELRKEYFNRYPDDKPHCDEGLITNAIARRVSKFLKSHEVKSQLRHQHGGGA